MPTEYVQYEKLNTSVISSDQKVKFAVYYWNLWPSVIPGNIFDLHNGIPVYIWTVMFQLCLQNSVPHVSIDTNLADFGNCSNLRVIEDKVCI